MDRIVLKIYLLLAKFLDYWRPLTYKLQLLMEYNEDDWRYQIAYIDVSKIYGFSEAPHVDSQPDAVNIFIYGGMMTILQEDHILKYLNKRFQKPIKNDS